jgi:hypothetical protein
MATRCGSSHALAVRVLDKLSALDMPRMITLRPRRVTLNLTPFAKGS